MNLRRLLLAFLLAFLLGLFLGACLGWVLYTVSHQGCTNPAWVVESGGPCR